MAERMGNLVYATEDSAWVRTGKFQTNSTSDPSTTEGIVSSVSRTGTGAFTVTLNDDYPNLLAVHPPAVVGSNGNQCHVESIDVTTPQMKVQLRDNTGSATDSNGEDVYITLVVRNSSNTYR